MNKILKFNWNERKKLFFSSDWHNYHNPIHWKEPIWKTRGYKDHIESLNDVANKINNRVKEDDILFFLGDGFLNATDGQVQDWFYRINCQNIQFIFGNHESNTYRMYREEMKETQSFSDVEDEIEIYPYKMQRSLTNVTFLGNYQEIQVGKQRISLSHFPFHVFNKSHKGAWALSGHSHNTDKTRNPDYPHGKYLDVGWDWKKDIWSYDEIEDVMSTKSISIKDHHDHATT